MSSTFEFGGVNQIAFFWFPEGPDAAPGVAAPEGAGARDVGSDISLSEELVDAAARP